MFLLPIRVDLGPQVNFLTGKNGSAVTSPRELPPSPSTRAHRRFLLFSASGGKSAVLTAIIVALGAKASATGRGAGIKGFIQTGKE